MPDNTLSDLSARLAALSHSEEAVRLVRQFSADLRKTRRRLEVFGASGALVRSPIMPGQAEALGFDTEEDQFSLLQGDVVATESAFFMGTRAHPSAKYVVLNSSCDLVPQRKQFAALLRVKPILESDENLGAKLNVLLTFTRTDAMFLPKLPDDPAATICNVIEFDGIAQISSSHLQLANRVASMSLLGWRIFASVSRAVVARANPREVEMRAAIESHASS